MAYLADSARCDASFGSPWRRYRNGEVNEHHCQSCYGALLPSCQMERNYPSRVLACTTYHQGPCVAPRNIKEAVSHLSMAMEPRQPHFLLNTRTAKPKGKQDIKDKTGQVTGRPFDGCFRSRRASLKWPWFTRVESLPCQSLTISRTVDNRARNADQKLHLDMGRRSALGRTGLAKPPPPLHFCMYEVCTRINRTSIPKNQEERSRFPILKPPTWYKDLFNLSTAPRGIAVLARTSTLHVQNKVRRF